jgi:hypothetical protein
VFSECDNIGTLGCKNITGLLRDLTIAFPKNVGIDGHCYVRAWCVSETLLADFHRCIELIHQTSVRVPEGVHTAALDPERPAQWVEFPDNEVPAVKRRPSPNGKN